MESNSGQPQTYNQPSQPSLRYENTNFGPTVNILGVNPLKKAVKPSFRIILFRIWNPVSGFSKFLFWILVLITSIGADTVRDAIAPAIDATVFCVNVAES